MIKTLLIVTSILFLSISSFSGSTYAQTADEREYQAKLKELKANIDALKAQMKDIKNSKNSLENELEANEKEISELNDKAKQIETELSKEKKQLALLREQRQKLQGLKLNQQTSASHEIATAYKLGQQSQLKTLLNQEDSALSARMLKYHQYIVSSRSEKIAELSSTIDSLEAIDREISVKTQQFEQQQQRLNEQKRSLELVSQKRKQTLAMLQKQLVDQDTRLNNLLKEKNQLESLINEVATLIAAIPTPNDHTPFAKQTGKLSWPVKGKIQNSFGSSKAQGRLTWDGVLIAASEGSEVKSIHGGRVVFSDWFKGLGMLMIVDHGSGYLSLYGHNQTLFKDVGDWISSGEVIALAGTSGGQTTSGVYFEIRHNGKPENPSKWCRG
ncbi:peptidoglycan DD-metalloendopeptidase family protein [Sessilibacter sp. MAH1]